MIGLYKWREKKIIIIIIILFFYIFFLLRFVFFIFELPAQTNQVLSHTCLTKYICYWPLDVPLDFTYRQNGRLNCLVIGALN